MNEAEETSAERKTVTDRFRVVAWSPIGIHPREVTYHVWDSQTRSQVLGRWEMREDAQAHADRCNKMGMCGDS